MQRQELHLAEKLRAKREKKLAQLAEKQEQEREDFIKKVDSSTNTDTVREVRILILIYHIKLLNDSRIIWNIHHV